MSNKFKKVVSVGVTMSTMLWSVGVSALLPVAASAATCPTLQSGDMVKASGRPAIYAVDANGKVLYFPSGDEFKSWNANESYGGYTTVTQECFDAIYLNAPKSAPFGVNFRPGSYVVKRASSDQLYVVLPGNQVAKITAAAANALYGSNRKTMTVADVFWPNYTSEGAAITEAKVHPGMLVSNGGKTWYVSANNQLREVTAAGMSANRFKAAFVRPVTSAMIAGLTTGEVVSSALSEVADRTQTGGGSSVVTPAPGGALSVALAANNPAGTTLADSTAHNAVLRVTLSGNAKVTGLTLNKSGFISNTSISGVEVMDSTGKRHGNVASSVNADNQVTLLFSGDPITVNGSETVTVAVNLGSVSSNGTLRMSLASVQTEGNASVSGSLPVMGNEFTVYDGANSVATVTLAPAAVNSSGATLNVDSGNWQDIAKFQLAETSNKEKVLLKEWSLYNNGTAADSDVRDVQLVAQDGTVLATAQQVSKTVRFVLAQPHEIDKGQTKTFTVRAKIVDGPGRTIQFTTYNDYDVVLTGQSSNAGLLASATGLDTTFPSGDQSATFNKVTIGSGTTSFGRDTSSPSGAVTPGQSNVTLAKFYVKPQGENMELRQIALGVVTGTADTFSGNITVRVNGASVYTAAATAVNNTSNPTTALTLSTYPTLVAGQNTYITVEGNIDTDVANGATSTVYLDLVQVKRVVTNDIVDPGVGVSAGFQMTVQAAALRVTNQATPVAQNVVIGATDLELANIELNAGVVSSGEDVKVSSIVVSQVTSGIYEDFGNLKMYQVNADGSLTHLPTTGSTVTGAASTTFNFSSAIVVPKTGAVTLRLKGDLVTSTADGSSHTFAVMSAADHVTSVGATNGNSVTETSGSGSGQALTIKAAGTLTVSLVSGGNGAPTASTTVTVGQTNVPVFGFKLTAQREALKLTTLRLMASGTIGTVNDIKNVRLYLNDSATPFATADQMSAGPGTNTSTVFTWTATDNLLPAAIQPGTPVTIYVKADVGPAGQAKLGDNFSFRLYSTSTTDLVVKGVSSGSTIAGSDVIGSAQSAGAFIITPFQVLVTGEAPTSGSSVTQAVLVGTQLARVKIQNNGSAKITVTGIRFTDSGSHTGNATTYSLKYSDQNSSNYVGNTASSSLGALDFLNLGSTGGSSSFTIDGGAYRYVTVSVSAIGAATTGDTWQLSVANIGDVTYSVAESDLGYSGNADADLDDTSTLLPADGKPTMGTIVKS